MLMINDVQLDRPLDRTGRGEATARSGAENKTAATVTAVFADSAALLLRLRDDVTLGDLANQLADCGRRHGGTPLYVRVTFRN